MGGFAQAPPTNSCLLFYRSLVYTFAQHSVVTPPIACAMAARYKVVLVGDKDVGKTSLFHRVLFGYFKDTDEENRSTLGFDCFEKSFSALGDLVEVSVLCCQGADVLNC